MQKNILIKAYVNLNLGDDLFIEMLCRRYPQHNFFLIQHKVKTKYLDTIKNLKIIQPVSYIDSIFSKFNIDFRINHILEQRIAKKCDAVINIGGSIFIQPTDDWTFKINEFNNLIESSKHFFVIGSNFGPYIDENFYEEYCKSFSFVDDVCFRDKHSYNHFKNLPNARLAPDIVFSLDTSSVRDNYSNEEFIVISVLDLSWRNDLKKYTDLYEQNIIQITKEILAIGKKVVLMSFCESEGDESAIKRIMNTYSHENLTSYFYKGDIRDALSVLNSSTAIVATRFHSLVLGWVLNKPTLPYIYSEKTLNLLNDVSYGGYSLPINNELEKIDVQKVLNQLSEENTINISELNNNAHKHFLKLDEYLN